jgi:branched-chain amino acid transport system substrate-binding protein
MRRALVALAAALSLTAAACGQKAGVEQQVAYGVPGQVATAPDGTVLGTVGPDGQLVGPDGQPIDPGTGPGDSTPGAPGSTPGAPGSTPGAPGSDPSDNPSGVAPPTTPPGGGKGDTTGVTATTIKIGIHAPVTGAAAIPQASFERAVGVYFDAINRRGGINGRKVQVYFEDDQFRPDTARAKCKDLAEQEKVFLLIGAAGADQIDACARYAASVGVPYLSGGVHQSRPGQASLSSLPTYFAVTLTYEQQVPLLARTYQESFNGEKVAVISADNDSLNDYHARAASALKSAAGGNFTYERRIPKNTTSEAPAIAAEICRSGAKAVVWQASPSSLLNVSKVMTCDVGFIGPGLSNGINVVTQVGCDKVDGARFYSPFPGMDVMRRNSEFVNAYRAKNGSEPDDIGAALFGLEKIVGAMLTAGGKDLTREGFMAAIARTKVFNTGIFPSTNFSSRFGGTAMHLLRADCSKKEYVTEKVNVRP